jgi:eukaryotic-like serine/threonine-protein kinase
MPVDLIADRFEIGIAIGSGGMGTVYRGIDTRTRETVAIKIIREGIHEAPARFAREIAALARVNHPQVVRYLASGVSARGPFLVMEWLDGEDLGKRMKHQGLSVADVMRLGLGLGRALVAVHAAGIVHRDIKPANVFFPSDESAIKLVDFGLARLKDASDALSHSGLLVGTPGYMAPETSTVGWTCSPWAVFCTNA